jgi:hypothetical protein
MEGMREHLKQALSDIDTDDDAARLTAREVLFLRRASGVCREFFQPETGDHELVVEMTERGLLEVHEASPKHRVISAYGKRLLESHDRLHGLGGTIVLVNGGGSR